MLRGLAATTVWIASSVALAQDAPPAPRPSERPSATSFGNTPLERFVNARSRDDARREIPAILAAGLDFAAVHAALADGRVYDADVPTGPVITTRTSLGVEGHHYMVSAPRDYDPARRWPLRVYLHGGMGAPAWGRLDGSWAPNGHRFTPADQITLVPAGWWDSMWWEWRQVANLDAILDEVRRTWNVDENRTSLIGASDGGIGAMFQAFRNPDPWSGLAALIASPVRLTNTFLRPDGQMHLSNLAGQRLRWLNGEVDPKFPVRVQRDYAEAFRAAGMDIELRFAAGAGHTIAWWERERPAIERFLSAERDPLPDRLAWSTERTDRYARRSWLIIDALRDGSTDTANVLPRLYGGDADRSPPPPVRPWGRVELARDRNTVTATTTGVARFTLLLAPDRFDLSRPVRVIVNGAVAFEGRVTPDVETLLSWAARDNDRTRLFAAALTIAVTAE